MFDNQKISWQQRLMRWVFIALFFSPLWLLIGWGLHNAITHQNLSHTPSCTDGAYDQC